MRLEHGHRECVRWHSLPTVGRDDCGRCIRLRIRAKDESQPAIGTHSTPASVSEHPPTVTIGLLPLPLQRPTTNPPALRRLNNPHTLSRRPAAPFNRPLTESLRDSANNPLCYVIFSQENRTELPAQPRGRANKNGPGALRRQQAPRRLEGLVQIRKVLVALRRCYRWSPGRQGGLSCIVDDRQVVRELVR